MKSVQGFTDADGVLIYLTAPIVKLSPRKIFETIYTKLLLNFDIMHRGQPGFEHRKPMPELRFEYPHMDMFFGSVENLVVAAIV